MFRWMTAAIAAVLLFSGAAHAGQTKGRINETGQTRNYGDGSDGNLRRGLTRIFNDLGNGVVKDVRTGLFWEKKSDDGTIHDKDNTYTWWSGLPVSPDGTRTPLKPLQRLMNGTMVSEFLATLNSPPCFTGHCDWRVPNVAELLSLVNYDTVSPATFDVFNTGCTAGCAVMACSCTASSGYWSTSTSMVNPDNADAWYVDFGVGFSFGADKTVASYVRAVRGGF